MTRTENNIRRDIARSISVSLLFVVLLALSSAKLSHFYDWCDNPANQFTIAIAVMLALFVVGFVCAMRYIKRKL